MKVIKYKVLGYIIKYNFETKTEDEIECLCEAEKPYSEANLELVKEEAYKGEYAIEDDGQPEPAVERTDTERISELEEALALLLSGDTR